MNINFAFLVVLALLNGTSSGDKTTATAIPQPTLAVDDAGKAAEGKTLLNATNTPVSSTKKITSTSFNNTAGTDKKPEEKENVLSTAGGVLHETSKNVHTIIKKNGSATTTTASTKAITTAASTKATTTTASTKATTTTASTKVADAPSSAASVPNATSPVVPAIIKNNGTGTDKENISSSAGSVPVTTSQNVEISKKDEADTPPAMKEVTDPVRNVPDLENDQRQGQFDVHSKKALPQPEEEPSTNFPVLFMISILAIVGGYFLYHNKSKIMGLIVEGRGSTSRRPRYNRLKNVEEAMPGMRNKISA